MSSYTEPDPGNSCLLTIDVQNDFTLHGAVAEVEGTYAIVPNLKKILDAFRSKDKLIVHVVRLYLGDGSNVDLCRRELIESGTRVAAPGSDGAELVDELKLSPDPRLDPDVLLDGKFQQVSDGEFIMYKSRWGAFYKTGLDEFLKEKGVNTLVFTGCNFPNCLRASIYEASERDYKIIMASDAVSGVYEKGLSELKNIGVKLMTAEELIGWIE